jgi:acetyl-CoA carboxylase biotin carboxyl carrier protein
MARIEVESEVTGRVWKIVTETGTKVSEGDTLLILESMKMEIPVESPCDGKVLEILLDEGESVNEEQIVAILDDNT